MLALQNTPYKDLNMAIIMCASAKYKARIISFAGVFVIEQDIFVDPTRRKNKRSFFVIANHLLMAAHCF